MWYGDARPGCSVRCSIRQKWPSVVSPVERITVGDPKNWKGASCRVLRYGWRSCAIMGFSLLLADRVVAVRIPYVSRGVVLLQRLPPGPRFGIFPANVGSAHTIVALIVPEL